MRREGYAASAVRALARRAAARRGQTARVSRPITVNLVSTGHDALDHRVFDKEARTLAGAGVRVRVIARHPRPERREGVEIVPLEPARGRAGRFLASPWRALAAVRRQPADVVWLHDLELLAISPLLRLAGRPAVVYDVHEDFANLMRRREWIPPPLRGPVATVLRALERGLACSVDAVVSVTEGLAGELPHRRRLALYNLPSRAFLEAAAGAEPPSRRPVDVVHLGTLSEERLAFLARVLAELGELRGTASARVVGVRPDQAKRLARLLPDAVDARVEGALPYERVPALLASCRVGVDVHPLLHPHLRHALPVKVVEYMAAGCGVVSSALPELERVLPPEARAQLTLLRSAEPREYARALAAWLDDPARLDAAGASLREAAGRLSWESQGERMLALVTELATGRHR